MMEEISAGKEAERERGCEHVGGDVESGAEGSGNSERGNVAVSLFTDSAEEFISTMEAVSLLCGLQRGDVSFDEGEFERWSSSVTFLKEWRYFCYEPKVVNFTYETDASQVKEVKGIRLPQFSSATVPAEQSSDARGSLNSKDFVLHAGGSVWALDWCPTMIEALDYPYKCEYLAVAAHPPDSSYHNIGAQLKGRGIVQIWCLLNTNDKQASCCEWPKVRPKKGAGAKSVHGPNVKLPNPRGRPRKNPLPTGTLPVVHNALSSPPPRKVGRPRKTPESSKSLTVTVNTTTSENTTVVDNIPPPKQPRGKPRKYPKKEMTHTMDVGEEFHSMKAPALVVDSTNASSKYSPENPCERPEMAHVETDNVDDSHAVTDSNDSKTISCTDLGDTNATNSTVHVYRRRPRKKPAIMEHLDVKAVEDESTVQPLHSLPIQNSSLEIEPSPSKKSRGRPRRGHDELLVADNLHAVQSPITVKSVPDQSGNVSNLTNVDASNMIQELSVRTCISAQPINEIDDNNTSLLQKRRRGRPKKGSEKSLTSTNERKHDLPIYTAPAHDANDAVVSGLVKQVESTNGVSVLPRTDGNVSSNMQPILSKRDLESVGSHIQQAPHAGNDAEATGLLENDLDWKCKNVTALPRVVLCLGHNGKVAWDVKWRPHCISNLKSKHQMGYLAVLLGNGSLEVWDIPYPSVVKNLYKASLKESTDPRFLKLRPVFRCSKLKFADRQSIPLTMEWSRSAPCDLILVGCHDGTVALWKFSAEDLPQDSRPLLCFTADDVPIRAVAWAPGESGPESANLMVTAGHEGLKFWDLRDPYRPLWELNPVQRIILSLDWLLNPSCLVFSLDDGTVRTLNLSKTAYDTLVTGKQFDASKHGVMHSYYRSQFAIWSVQVSPMTGLTAYCCADGSTLCFQLTARSVVKEKNRHRMPHFLCGRLMERENTLTIDTPLPYTSVGELLRPVRGLPSRSNYALSEVPQVQDDPSEGSRYKNSKSSSRSEKGKSSASRSGKLLCETQRGDASGTVGGEKQEDLKTEVTRSNNFLVFPPKIVAMQRVRWNLNKGSERWLCYGGAAGIIRCQEVGLAASF